MYTVPRNSKLTHSIILHFCIINTAYCNCVSYFSDVSFHRFFKYKIRTHCMDENIVWSLYNLVILFFIFSITERPIQGDRQHAGHLFGPGVGVSTFFLRAPIQADMWSTTSPCLYRGHIRPHPEGQAQKGKYILYFHSNLAVCFVQSFGLVCP